MIESPPAKPRISVSIVVFNSDLDALRATLQSLRSTVTTALAAGLAGVDAMIIDNGSDAGYRERLLALVGSTQPIAGFTLNVHPLPANRGFGAGHNYALARSAGEYHLILNPDVELAADVLARGVGRLQDDDSVVLLSPYAQGGAGAQEFLCKRKPSVLVLMFRAFMPGLGRRLFAEKMQHYEMSDVCGDEEEVAVPLASGCFMLARTAQLRQVGGFDEDYFLYFEDFDLCMRLGEYGKLLYAPQLRIVHHGGYAASKGWRHLQLFARSGCRFFRQYGWRWA